MDELLNKYVPIVGRGRIEQLKQIAKSLKGMKVVHVNSTRSGGGVAEILTTMVPFMNELGLEACWEVVEGDLEFFKCTKSFHNSLQGMPISIHPSILQHYETINQGNAERLAGLLAEADIVVIHDPQPLPLIAHFPHRKGKWIWRCHIDVSQPYQPTWNYLEQFISKFDAVIFSLEEFAKPLAKPMYLIAPSIDPLSQKNIELSENEVKGVYGMFGLDPERPILLQVSRFDRFKDPLGVIEAYRLAKKYHSSLQLVLAGGTATDDPEGEAILQEVELAKGNDPDVHVLVLPPDSSRIINALQRVVLIVIQKSLKEGFGLTVSEAMWKYKPVIGGNVGGIRTQIIDYHTGFLVNTFEGAANRIRFLFENKDKINEMGQEAREFVTEKFLITRNLIEYLSLFVLLHFPDHDRIELSEVSIKK